MIYDHREWAVAADRLLLDAINGLTGHQSIDIIDAAGAARRKLNVCPKCGAIRDEPCLTGGNLPVGDLPGDLYLDRNNKPTDHKQRIARR